MKQIFKFSNIVSGLLILIAQSLIAQQTYNENRLYSVDGIPVHLVPKEVVRPAMDTLLSSAVNSPSTSPSRTQQYKYVVQVGTFAIKENALRLEDRLKQEGYKVYVREYHSKNKEIYHVVSVGHYMNVEEARQKLRDIKLTYKLDGLYVRKDKRR